MIPLAALVNFSNSVGFGTLAIIAALACAQFITTRRDKRYEIASGERDEWREKSGRLERELHLQDTHHQAQVHELGLKVKELEGEIKRLEALPRVEALLDLITAHDERSFAAWTAQQEISQQILLALTELVARTST